MQTVVRGPILNPKSDGSVEFISDCVLIADSTGKSIEYVGPFDSEQHAHLNLRRADGLVIPPMLDCHIHIPQHPIRGRFLEGVGYDTPHGRLLAGLNRNVFPAEACCDDAAHTERVVWTFLRDTLAQGVVGGAAYMTVSALATQVALEILPAAWSVGFVLMNQNCPEYLRTDETTLAAHVDELAEQFGQRLIVTDRFAVSVSSPLRRRGVELAQRWNLRMQTHLNEQAGEKQFVERELYPHAGSYTSVYAQDGLLSRSPIMAHCVHMRGDEWDQLATAGAFVAHCPTSNALLGSGVMPLLPLRDRNLSYAICTDVGASPTTSLLAEMAQFLRVHEAVEAAATPSEAFYRVTLGAERVIGLAARPAAFAPGEPFSFLEVDVIGTIAENTFADSVIRDNLLGFVPARDEVRTAYEALRVGGLSDPAAQHTIDRDIAQTATRLEGRVSRVTLQGNAVYDRQDPERD
jgi:guanine deaminase